MPIGSWLASRRHLLLMLIAGVIAPLALFAVNFVQTRSQSISAAEDVLARHAAILSEHTARVLDGYALVFDLLETDLGHHRDTDISRVISDHLAEYVDRAITGSAILVLDRDGAVLATSLGLDSAGENHAARAYFRDAAAHPDYSVGEQMVDGRPMVTLSRRSDSGRVYVALIAGEYFEGQFDSTADSDCGNVVTALYRTDGHRLVRYPSATEEDSDGRAGLMQRIPDTEAGSYRTAPGEGKPRHYAFHRVPNYPLYVTYGIDSDELVADWRASTLANGLLALAAALLLGAVSFLALRRAGQAARTEGALAALVSERTAEVELRTSEALQAMRARELALQQAERANAAKAHFLAAASHDLRQPIQGLRLFLEVLEARIVQPENLRVLALAKKALEGAEDLLSTLLDVSTLEAGMVEPTIRDVPATTILDQLAEEFRRQAESRLLALRYVPCSAVVRTDPVLLSRLLRNLLTNAIRYTERGGILFGCRRHGHNLRIEVWDTGAGIPGDKLESVFEDFVQLGNPERDRTKGLGLGLSVVRRTAALMGHEIGVRSTVGKGTVFWVQLPMAPAAGLDTQAVSDFSLA